MKKKINRLMDQGVVIPDPQQVFIDDSVNPDRIANGAVLWPGSRILGADTLMLAGVQIGSQGPATVENCRFGPGAEIASGYCSGAVLLAGACLGAGAHVRGGTILEEGASTAHTVGLKQTILLPHVTLGSLINFCDVLMAGGTGPKRHSEVGSAYIHFNFTPNQDKATPSLLGDVPGGVMLDREPIFLGGQGGLVGPCRLAFGTVIAAGSIFRKDQLEPNRLIFEGGSRSFSVANNPGGYRNLRRIVANNLVYIANLVALERWYGHVRRYFVHEENFPEALLAGLRHTLALGIDERIRRFDQFLEKLSPATDSSRSLLEGREAIFQTLSDWAARDGDIALRDRFLAGLQAAAPESEGAYLASMASLSPDLKDLGTRWLQSVVDRVVGTAREAIPDLRPFP